MGKIILRRDNVVKEVESEDLAAELETKGFLRDGARKGDVAAPKELNADLERVEKELAETKEKLAEATKYAEERDKENEQLKAELEGTKEQLETAIKKNNSKTKESK